MHKGLKRPLFLSLGLIWATIRVGEGGFPTPPKPPWEKGVLGYLPPKNWPRKPRNTQIFRGVEKTSLDSFSLAWDERKCPLRTTPTRSQDGNKHFHKNFG